jgi:hypothetical protein
MDLLGFRYRPLTIFDLTLDSSSSDEEEEERNGKDSDDDEEEETDNDVLHKVSVTSSMVGSNNNDDNYNNETRMELAFEQLNLNFERGIHVGGPRRATKTSRKGDTHHHHHHPVDDDKAEEKDPRSTAAAHDDDAAYGNSRSSWKQQQPQQQWDAVSELTDPEADEENRGPYSLDEFLSLVQTCEDFIHETACEIEESQRFRGSNTVVSPGDSVSQCKAQYGRLLPGAMQVRSV